MYWNHYSQKKYNYDTNKFPIVNTVIDLNDVFNALDNVHYVMQGPNINTMVIDFLATLIFEKIQYERFVFVDADKAKSKFSSKLSELFFQHYKAINAYMRDIETEYFHDTQGEKNGWDTFHNNGDHNIDDKDAKDQFKHFQGFTDTESITEADNAGNNYNNTTGGNIGIGGGLTNSHNANSQHTDTDGETAGEAGQESSSKNTNKQFDTPQANIQGDPETWTYISEVSTNELDFAHQETADHNGNYSNNDGYSDGKTGEGSTAYNSAGSQEYADGLTTGRTVGYGDAVSNSENVEGIRSQGKHNNTKEYTDDHDGSYHDDYDNYNYNPVEKIDKELKLFSEWVVPYLFIKNLQDLFLCVSGGYEYE